MLSSRSTKQIDGAGFDCNILAKSESRFRTLVSNIPGAVYQCFYEPAWTMEFISDMIQEISGYPASDFICNSLRPYTSIIHPDDRAMAEKAICEGVRDKEPYMIEYRIMHADGSFRWVYEKGQGIFTEDGEVLCLDGVIFDITKCKLADQIQMKLFAELKQANHELKDFAYIVSHDLKAPLRGIKNLADWLSADYADKFDEDGREQMDLLLAQVDRMHNLIDGVLQYSGVGRINEERVEVNLNELVSDVIDTIAPPKNIAITVENQLPCITCEKTRVFQIFQNLLGNAVKYMDKPEGKIRVGCVEEDGFWKFSIADNGPEIEEKHFERIFQIFQTLSPHKGAESTGVGLAIVKKIVEMYGGRVRVESEPGEGNTFFFTLPAGRGAADGKRELAASTCRVGH